MFGGRGGDFHDREQVDGDRLTEVQPSHRVSCTRAGSSREPRSWSAIDRFTSNTHDRLIDDESYRRRLKQGAKPAGMAGLRQEK